MMDDDDAFAGGDDNNDNDGCMDDAQYLIMVTMRMICFCCLGKKWGG